MEAHSPDLQEISRRVARENGFVLLDLKRLRLPFSALERLGTRTTV